MALFVLTIYLYLDNLGFLSLSIALNQKHEHKRAKIMVDRKKNNKATEQLQCISFGGDTFKFDGYIALPEKKAKHDHYAIGSVSDFKALKDNSVCAVKFIFTLERIGNDAEVKENFVALMSELYRVCAHGALVEIKTTHEDYIKAINDPLLVRTVNEGLISMLDASWRKKVARDTGLAHTLQAFDNAGVDFMSLKSLGHFSSVAMSRIEGKEYASEADILKDLDGIECPFTANTFYLACRKVAGHNFALVQIPGIDELTSEDYSVFNSHLPAGVRGCGSEPYVMQIYNIDEKHDIFLSPQVKEHGYWELPETFTFAKLLALYASKYVKFKFANIGANLGWYSLLASKFTSHVTVDAFEPTPETFSYLTNSIKLNQLEHRVNAINMALSDSQGEFDFFINSTNAGNNSFLAFEGNTEAFGAEYTKISVKADTLDNFYADKDKSEWPHIILIDVEGHEPKVFAGAKKMFEQGFRPLIVSEFVPALLAKSGRPTFHEDLVNKYNYTMLCINQDLENTIIPINLDYVNEVYDNLADVKGDAAYLNIIFVPDCFDLSSGSLAFKD